MGQFLGRAAGHLAGNDKPLGHILQRGLICKQVVVLKHKARAAAQGVDLGMGSAVQLDAAAVKIHRAGICPFEKIQAAQHSGLAAAAGAEDGHHIALVHIQINALEHLQRAEGLAQVSDFQHSFNSFVRRGC